MDDTMRTKSQRLHPVVGAQDQSGPDTQTEAQHSHNRLLLLQQPGGNPAGRPRSITNPCMFARARARRGRGDQIQTTAVFRVRALLAFEDGSIFTGPTTSQMAVYSNRIETCTMYTVGSYRLEYGRKLPRTDD